MERNFKGIWIPKEIWISENLSIMEKIFYVEIDSLDGDNGCFASNAYFADFFKLSKSRCSEIISSLEKKDFISINLIYKPGTKSVKKRIITCKLRYSENQMGYSENRTGYSEKTEDNNTINNTINNTVNNTSNISTTVDSKSTADVVYEYYKSLDLVRHKKLTDTMKKAIKKVNKSYTLEEIKVLLDRHEAVVKKTKSEGKYAVRVRGLDVFFGQKLGNAAESLIIYEEYLEGGSKYEKHLKGGIKVEDQGTDTNIQCNDIDVDEIFGKKS